MHARRTALASVRHLHLRRTSHAQAHGTVPPMDPVEAVLPPGPDEALPPVPDEMLPPVPEQVPPAPTAGER
jgi:hypothetical protein